MARPTPRAADWLRACLGHRVSTAALERARELSISEWEWVVDVAARQSVIPLVHHRLRSAEIAVPGPVAAVLRDLALVNARRSMVAYRDLTDVLGALKRAGIATIVLKGMHLADLVYRSTAVRPMCDVDLMVKRADLERAAEVLLARGYRPRAQPDLDVDYARHHHLHPLQRPGGIPVELHWTIARPSAPFFIDLDGLWDRARPATIGGVPASVLAPEDLVLHLSVHAAHDHQLDAGLRWCVDVSETIRHHAGEIDWDALCRRAREWGAAKPVYLMLRLSRDLLAADVPARALAGLEPARFDARLLSCARRELLSGTERSSMTPAVASVWASRLAGKLGVLLRSALPSRALIGRLYAAPPNSSRIYACYALRWKDLLVRHGGSLWRLLRRDPETVASASRAHEREALRAWLSSGS